MSLYSHCRPQFGTSKCTRSIHTSWSTPLCLGSIQILQLAVNEHKNGLQNAVDEDDAGDTATTDVAIAVNDDAAPLVMTTMKGNPVSIAMTMTTTILLTTAPVNVTISWTMTTNDGNNDADIGNDGKDSLPPPMTATTAEMMMGTMGGSSVWRGNATISWTRGARGA